VVDASLGKLAENLAQNAKSSIERPTEHTGLPGF